MRYSLRLEVQYNLKKVRKLEEVILIFSFVYTVFVASLPITFGYFCWRGL